VSKAGIEADHASAQAGIDAIAKLVAERYPKGTTSELGKALRHELHKLGRLNDPEPVGPVLMDQAATIHEAASITPADFGSDIWDAESIRSWQLKLAWRLHGVLHSEVPSGLFETRKRRLGFDAYIASITPPKA
jgi:hypothetical protein